MSTTQTPQAQKKQPEGKPKFPKVKKGDIVGFNHEGNTLSPSIAIAKSDVTSNGRLDLLILPDTGGEVDAKDGIPHHSEFATLENPSSRIRGSWKRLTEK